MVLGAVIFFGGSAYFMFGLQMMKTHIIERRKVVSQLCSTDTKLPIIRNVSGAGSDCPAGTIGVKLVKNMTASEKAGAKPLAFNYGSIGDVEGVYGVSNPLNGCEKHCIPKCMGGDPLRSSITYKAYGLRMKPPYSNSATSPGAPIQNGYQKFGTSPTTGMFTCLN